MKRVAILLALAAAIPLAGCQTPSEVARERCKGAYPAGSPGYAACYQREYKRRMRELQEDQQRDLDLVARTHRY